MVFEETRYQVLATLCVNILACCYGVALGWPSFSLLILQSDDTPLASGPLTTAQGSWIGSLIALGGFFGNLLFGWLSGRVGRKPLLLAAVVPMFLGWALIYVAPHVNYLYAARLLLGISGGAGCVVVPVFVTEIASVHIRGTLGSIFVLSSNLGILLGFVMGYTLQYETLPLILMAGNILYLSGVIFLPETPQYLLRVGRIEEAIKSLRFYRNLCKETSPEEVSLLQAEISRLQTHKSANTDPTPKSDDTTNTENIAICDPITYRDFCTPHARKAFIIGVFLLWLKSFTGLYVMVTYAGQIFTKSGSFLSPNASAIVIGAIQLGGTYVASLLVDRLGRRMLLAMSAIGTGASLVGVAVYQQFLVAGVAGIENYGAVPVVCLSAAMFLGSCGMLPLPFVVMAEVMPAKIRSYGYSMGLLTLWVFAFTLMKIFPLLVPVIGLHGCFYAFATCSFAGALFVFAYLPETRGKSFEEIRRLLEGSQQ